MHFRRLRSYELEIKTTEGKKKALTTNVFNYPSEEKNKLLIVFIFLTDIQECYEVTLQLNKEQTVVKEDSRQDAWEVIFFSLLYIIDWRKYAQCLRCMLCAVLCLLAAQ